MSLLITGDIVVGCVVVLLSIVLGAMASYTTEATPRYTLAVLSGVVILVAFKALGDIVASVKQLVVM